MAVDVDMWAMAFYWYKTGLYNALRRSSSSGGFGGARYPSSLNICSSFAALPAFIAATLLSAEVGALPPGNRESWRQSDIGKGEDVWRVKHTRRGRAGTESVPSLVDSSSAEVYCDWMLASRDIDDRRWRGKQRCIFREI